LKKRAAGVPQKRPQEPRKRRPTRFPAPAENPIAHFGLFVSISTLAKRTGDTLTMAGPVEFVDGLVKGVILISYDFAWLSCVGFAIPFMRKTRRVWRSVFATMKRLSSLTYLILWVALSVGIGMGTGTQLAWEAAGYASKPSSMLPIAILTVM